MSIKKNLNNNHSVSILYRAINKKTCFYPPFKETVSAAHNRVNNWVWSQETAETQAIVSTKPVLKNITAFNESLRYTQLNER